MKLSGLQKDVLQLYRTLLKTVKRKENFDANVQKKLEEVVKKEFRAQASSVSKLDFKLIEHKLRQGYKQKKLIEMPGFNAATVITKKH